MLTVFHSVKVTRVLRFSADKGIRYPFIYLLNDDGKKSLEESGLTEIPLYALTDEERLFLEKEYINSISELGKVHGSISWWANAISEKNEHLSTHYQDICRYYALMRTLERNPGLKEVFVVCGPRLQEQLIESAGKVKGVCLDAPIFRRMKKMSFAATRTLKAILSAYRLLLRKWLIPRSLIRRSHDGLSGSRPFYVIRTWLDGRFLKKANPAVEDSYFGRLPQEAKDRGENVLIVAGVLNSFGKVVGKAALHRDLLIVPEEYFIYYRDFARAMKLLFLKRHKFQESLSINGVELSAIYRRVFEESALSGGMAQNLVRYFIAKRLAEKVPIGTYIHTYENYAWEKMYVAGLKEVRPQAIVLGFQHAFISRNSFKYFLGRGESENAPLPDKIITLGEVTRGMLEKYGEYKHGSVEAGCALRQTHIQKKEPFTRKRHNRVLVPLTMAAGESAAILKFLCSSGLSGSKLEVVVRAHPALPVEDVKKRLRFRLPENFKTGECKKVEDELQTVDAVIYTWTTLALEGLMMGVPAIHLDILDPLYIDPLFECESLKRTVSEPGELIPALNDLYGLDHSEYLMEAEAARVYISGYFNPVTNQNLKPFFNESAKLFFDEKRREVCAEC